jgi:hypothetical protein
LSAGSTWTLVFKVRAKALLAAARSKQLSLRQV